MSSNDYREELYEAKLEEARAEGFYKEPMVFSNKELITMYQRELEEVGRVDPSPSTRQKALNHILIRDFRKQFKRALLVAPGGSGKSTFFTSPWKVFCDEEVVMKSLVPVDDEEFSSKGDEFKQEWIEKTGPSLVRAYNMHIPLAVSVRMFNWMKDRIDVNLEKTVLYAVIISPSKIDAQLAKRAKERGVTKWSLVEKNKRELLQLQSYEDFLFVTTFDQAIDKYRLLSKSYTDHQWQSIDSNLRLVANELEKMKGGKIYNTSWIRPVKPSGT